MKVQPLLVLAFAIDVAAAAIVAIVVDVDAATALKLGDGVLVIGGAIAGATIPRAS